MLCVHSLIIFATLAGVANAIPLNHTCRKEDRIFDCTKNLFCNDEGYCDICTNDDQCGDGYFCVYSKKEKINICNYEPLVHKWNTRIIVGMCCVFLAGIFVSGVGIGGGAIIVPILQLICLFPADYTIMSSNPVISGGSLAVSLVNLRYRHYKYDRPLINYNIASIIEPISWLGTIIGVILNGTCPDWLLYICQIILFAYTAISTFQKGYKEYKKNKALKQDADKEKELEDLEKPLNEEQSEGKENPKPDNASAKPLEGGFVDPIKKDGEENQNKESSEKETDQQNEKENDKEAGKDKGNDEGTMFIDPIEKENQNDENNESANNEKKDLNDNVDENVEATESKDPENLENELPQKPYNPWVLVILAVIWIIFVVTPFIRGGTQTESIVGIKFCSTTYWIVTFAPFPIYILISYWMITIARKYPVINPKTPLNLFMIIKIVIFGIVAGIASGFLGIGGGIIKGPMLLSLGIEAEEMAATSSFMVLLTASITSISYIANGTLGYAEFGIYSAFGFVSFLIGIFVLKAIIKKTNNRTLILWLLGAVITVATFLLGYIGVTEIIDNFKLKRNMNFRPYCT